jgi:hypothetical protein
VALSTTLLAAQEGPVPRPRSYRVADVVIGLERTACFGTCPIYRVSVSGDGAVEYQGVRFVQTVGVEKATVDPEQVLSLLNEFLRVRFFDAADRYAGSERARRAGSDFVIESVVVTALPSQILTLRLGERTKRVVLYDNDPLELGKLPDLIDRAVGSERWVGKSG